MALAQRPPMASVAQSSYGPPDNIVRGSHTLLPLRSPWNDRADQEEALSLTQLQAAAAEALLKKYVKLDVTMKSHFEEHARGDLESYLELINNMCEDQQSGSKITKASDFVQPVFEAVNQYMPLLKDISAVHPSPAGIILSGIACILNVHKNLQTLQQGILADLSSMGDQIRSLKNEWKLLHEDKTDLIEQLVTIFVELFDYINCVYSYVYHDDGKKRGSMKALGSATAGKTGVGLAERDRFNAKCKSLRDTIHGRRENLKTRLQYIGRDYDANLLDAMHQTLLEQRNMAAANQQQFDEVVEVGGGVLELLHAANERNLRDAVLDRLPFTRDYQVYYDQIYAKCTGNTGKALLDHSKYREWKTSRVSNIIWVTGESGLGKSCLAALSIRDLESSGHIFSYAICKRQPGRRENIPIAATILHKLLQQVPKNTETSKFYATLNRQGSASFSMQQLSTALGDLVSYFDEIFIVFDALDECDDQERIATLITDLLKVPGRVKILALSRPGHAHFESALGSIAQRIKLDLKLNSHDLTTYIDAKLASYAFSNIEDDNLKPEIHRKVLERSSGNFQFADSMLKLLERLESDGERREALKQLPEDIPASYDDRIGMMTQRIGQPQRLDRAFKIIWYTYYAKRPLTEAEMMQALVMTNGLKALDLDFVPRPREVEALCDNLVRIDETDKSREFAVCHQSFAEYLEALRYEEGHPFRKYATRDDLGYDPLASVCVDFLLLENFSHGPSLTESHFDTRRTQYPFLDYAALNWSSHISDYGASNPLLDKVRHLLTRTSSLGVCLQHAVAQSVLYHAIPLPGATNVAHLIAFTGDPAIRAAIDIPTIDLIRGNELGCTPCDYALHLEARTVVQWLVEACSRSKIPTESIASQVDIFRQAAKLGWLDVIQTLLQSGISVDPPDGIREQSALSLAAGYGHLDLVRTLLDAGADVHRRDENGRTPFLSAIDGQQEQIWRLLMRNGANCHDKDDRNMNALFYAVENNDTAAIEVMLSQNVDHTVIDSERTYSVLHYAAMNNNAAMVDKFCSMGISVNIEANGGWKPLHLAAYNGAVEAALRLLNHDADMYPLAGSGRTPWHLAALKGHLSILEKVLASRPTTEWIQLCDDDGYTLLHCAVSSGNYDCVKFLLDHGANVNASTTLSDVDIMENFPVLVLLLSAADIEESAKVRIARELLSRGVDVNIGNANGLTPFHCIARYGISDLLTDFYSAGADPDKQTGQLQWPCLYFSANMGHESFAIKLHETFPDLDPNAENEQGFTALHAAAIKDVDSLAKRLLSDPRLVLKATEKNYFPIHSAVFNGSVKTLQLLLHKSDLTGRGPDDHNVLTIAAFNGHLECLKVLVEQGSMDPGLPDYTGEYPLTAAAKYGQVKAVKYLLGLLGSSALDVKNHHGVTALHHAVTHRNLELIEMLKAAGASNAISNHFGWTPLSQALRYGDEDALALLLDSTPSDVITAGFEHSDVFGNNAVHLAASGNNDTLLRQVLQHAPGIIDQANAFGHTPLLTAASESQESTFLLLHSQGASLNVVSKDNRTAMWFLAANGLSRCLEVCLKDRSANRFLNLQSAVDERTPLMSAIRYQQSTCVQLLLSRGADPLIKDAYGWDAFDHAAQFPHIQKLLPHRQGSFPRPFNHGKLLETAKRTNRLILGLDGRAQMYNRTVAMSILTSSLLLLNHPSTIPHLKLCYTEILDEHRCDGDYRSDYTCSMCETIQFSGDFYECITCGYSCLCDDCYKAFKSNDFRTIEIVSALEKLEAQLLPLFITLQQWDPSKFRYLLFCLNSTPVIIESIRKLQFSFKRIIKDQAYQDFFPRFLNRCSYALDFFQILDEANHLEDSISLTTEEKTKKLAEIRRKYTKWSQRFCFSSDVQHQPCNGHVFFKLESTERQALLRDRTFFDPYGRLTPETLEQMLQAWSSLSLDDSHALKPLPRRAVTSPSPLVLSSLKSPFLDQTTDVTLDLLGNCMVDDVEQFLAFNDLPMVQHSSKTMVPCKSIGPGLAQRAASLPSTLTRSGPHDQQTFKFVEEPQSLPEDVDAEGFSAEDRVEIILDSALTLESLESLEFYEFFESIIEEDLTPRRRKGHPCKILYNASNFLDRKIAVAIELADSIIPGFVRRYAEQRKTEIESKLAELKFDQKPEKSDLSFTLKMVYNLVFGIPLDWAAMDG